MEEERDVVVFTDDEGNEFELDVIDYFEYEGNEYAVLCDLAAELEDEAQQEVYIMKVVVNGEEEEFVPAEEELMDTLAGIVESRLSEDCECGCGCEGEDCDCHEHDCDCHEHDCDCGCHDHE